MTERRPKKSELRLARLTADEAEEERRGVFELFHEEEPEQRAEDAPLARADDDHTAA